MKQKTIEDYKREILNKFNVVENRKIAGYDSKLTSSSVKEACAYLCDKRNSKADIEILNGFFKCHDNALPNYKKIINDFDKDKFIPICRFLNGRTKNPDITRIELVAWLVDFRPRPYPKYIKESFGGCNDKIEEVNLELNRIERHNFNKKEDGINSFSDFNANFINESSKNQINIPQKPFKDEIKPKPKVNLVFKFSITLMLVLMLILVYSIAKHTFFISKDVESIRKISTNELPNYLQANHEIWKGKSNTGEVEYFPTAGKHPETGEKLKIVSNDEIKEIIKTSSAEVVDSKNVKNQDESAGELILNPNFKNDSNSKEIAILVFGEDAQLNKKVVAQLEKSVFEDYNSTESLIMPNNFTQNIKNNLITGNISILGNKLNEYTDYVCVVKANHTFRKSSINSQIIICDLEVMYSVYDSKSIKQKNLSKSATYTGQGFTKLEAQNNAIKRME